MNRTNGTADDADKIRISSASSAVPDLFYYGTAVSVIDADVRPGVEAVIVILPRVAFALIIANDKP